MRKRFFSELFGCEFFANQDSILVIDGDLESAFAIRQASAGKRAPP